MVGWHYHSMYVSLSKLWELVIDREVWRATVHGVTKNQTWLSNLTVLNWTERYWNHTESVILSLWSYGRNQYKKIFENNVHIFKYSVTFTQRDLWLAIESLRKVKSLKKHRGWLQRRKHLSEQLISTW